MSTIGFIGTGNMGSALIRGMNGQEAVSALMGVDLSREKLEELAGEAAKFTPAASAAELVKACDYVILAVKPQQIEQTLAEVSSELDASTCLVSIAAGVRAAKLKTMCGGVCPVVRVMPNTPALVGRGVFAVCLDDPDLTDGQKTFLSDLFDALGQLHLLPEKDFDAFTAVAGSGPAYVFAFMEAIIEAGVTLGLPRDKSAEMVKALFSGSSILAEESGLSPTTLREMVTSPAGTTIMALNHLDREGVRGAIIDAVRQSYLRGVELGKGS